mmetsp:Transcript_3086/g.4391  ORF Transcript_3086/g.4391 Transcript_3086/m.4391 type:complete len:167 (+) Transcript_3086:1092-1592(+)
MADPKVGGEIEEPKMGAPDLASAPGVLPWPNTTLPRGLSEEELDPKDKAAEDFNPARNPVPPAPVADPKIDTFSCAGPPGGAGLDGIPKMGVVPGLLGAKGVAAGLRGLVVVKVALDCGMPEPADTPGISVTVVLLCAGGASDGAVAAKEAEADSNSWISLEDEGA